MKRNQFIKSTLLASASLILPSAVQAITPPLLPRGVVQAGKITRYACGHITCAGGMKGMLTDSSLLSEGEISKFTPEDLVARARFDGTYFESPLSYWDSFKDDPRAKNELDLYVQKNGRRFPKRSKVIFTLIKPCKPGSALNMVWSQY